MKRLFTMAMLAGLMLGAWAPMASAQTARERRAAGTAYNRASAAYLAEEWAAAAQWFETAHRLAPNAAALTQAVRAHKLAGNGLRAATLSLRLLAGYEDEEQAAATAREVLSQSRGHFVRVDVTCEACTIELDGTVQEHPSFFVTPGEDHHVTASFASGAVSRTVAGPRGTHRELTLEAPATAEAWRSDDSGTVVAATTRPNQEPREESRGSSSSTDGASGISPAWVIGSAVLTAGAGAFLVWSALDTLAGVEPYEATPSPEGLAAGQDKELRTNIMIGVTAGLAALTALLLVFTDFRGDDASTSASIGPLPGGAAATIQGCF